MNEQSLLENSTRGLEDSPGDVDRALTTATRRERPILFTGAMVRAILEGKKTQTRRVIKPQYDKDWSAGWSELFKSWAWSRAYHRNGLSDVEVMSIGCPYGKVGDLLWVRESMRYSLEHDNHYFTADNKGVGLACNSAYAFANRIPQTILPRKNIPSIHMPRWASRLTLEITEVRVQRLQDISEEEVTAEGLRCERNRPGFEIGTMPWNGDNSMYWYDAEAEGWTSAQRAYESLWDSINVKNHPWESNPWVWAITFRPLPAEGRKDS
jgi:hypothetical protein